MYLLWLWIKMNGATQLQWLWRPQQEEVKKKWLLQCWATLRVLKKKPCLSTCKCYNFPSHYYTIHTLVWGDNTKHELFSAFARLILKTQSVVRRGRGQKRVEHVGEITKKNYPDKLHMLKHSYTVLYLLKRGFNAQGCQECVTTWYSMMHMHWYLFHG